jgi:hypothetical protein
MILLPYKMQFDDLVACPYNQDHQIARTDLAKHEQRCKDKPKKGRVPQEPREETKTPVEVVSPYSAPINIDSDVLKTIAPPPGFTSGSPKKAQPKFEEEPSKTVDQPPQVPTPQAPQEVRAPKAVSAPAVRPPPPPPKKQEDDWVIHHGKKPKVKPPPSTEAESQSRTESLSLAEMQLAPDLAKRRKAIRKKLKDIQDLEGRRSRGEKLDPQQTSKLSSKRSLEQELKQLSN